MIIRFLLLYSLTLSCSLMAATLKLDSLTIGATTYSNITVLGANATDVYFTHDHGIANVKLKYLPPDVQKKFNYDPKIAADAERKQLEEDANYQHSLASSIAAQVQKTARTAQQSAGSTQDSLADPVSETSLLGKPGPDLKVEKWLGDRPASEGKYVLISFWAPWSVPCRKAIPDLNSLQKKFAEKLVVIGVTSDSEAQVAEMTDPKIEFPLGIDSSAKLSTEAGVTSIPCVLLLDPKGIVRYQGHPAAVTEAKLQELIPKAAQ